MNHLIPIASADAMSGRARTIRTLSKLFIGIVIVVEKLLWPSWFRSCRIKRQIQAQDINFEVSDDARLRGFSQTLNEPVQFRNTISREAPFGQNPVNLGQRSVNSYRVIRMRWIGRAIRHRRV